MSSTQTPQAPHAADHEAARSSVTPARTAAAADVTVTDTTCTSSNTSITIARTSTGSGSDALAYCTADVVRDATAVRSAFANNEYGTNITARSSEIAAEHDATMTELARIMADLGCQVAYSLDGGGSSAMYWNGGIINRPSNGGESAASDILYIARGPGCARVHRIRAAAQPPGQ